LYEWSPDKHNVLGFYIFDANGNMDTGCGATGLCATHPDLSALNSGGCLIPGDSIVITVQAGKSIGFYVRPDGYSWASSPTGTGPVYYSKTTTSIAPTQSTNYFGWTPFAGSFIFGLEDSSSGVVDYNDALFGVRLDGDWNKPGFPTSADPCLVATLDCKTFSPYSYAQYVYTPGCVPYIPLDIGVGTDTKDCEGFYAIPAGWEIAPYNELSINASTAYATNWWKTQCAVGTDPLSGQYVGYNSAGECTGFNVETITDGFTTCYRLGCMLNSC
jgi:hypothetical protein